MDRRSWPWKKKSSDKAAAAVDSTTIPTDSAGSLVDQAKQESYKKPKYVQISVESYSHLTGLEDQVKSYEDQMKTFEEEVNELNEKLSDSQTEITNKGNMVKQHAKVAEEAVSGWEKAEAEAAALKTHLESVTLLKLTAEDRASHLDGALKECMRQIRNLKEDHEQKLHELALNKTKQYDKMKHDLEAKIAGLDQELLRAAAENAALSRSLQERSNMIINLSEDKSQAEAEIELLKNNIRSCEKEINSLKYEVHVVTKELEIRNEEKDMIARSAEVSNKQHLEGAKKIAKLEAECQRLRGLVRKKLPGPAALAQMKLEVESLGRDYGETRLRRSPIRPSTPHMPTFNDFSLDGIQKYQKENELLTDRLMAMEEETKMLKEALANRNNELQTSRSIYARTACKLQSLEAQLVSPGEHKSPPKSNYGSMLSQNASNPPSLTSLSEDGNDDAASCSGSWTTAVKSELSHIKREKSIDSLRKVENSSQLGLMDDFLEMEKLAYNSNESKGAVSKPDISIKLEAENGCASHSEVAPSKYNEPPNPMEKQESSEGEVPALDAQPDTGQPPLMKLQSVISLILESMPKETDKFQLLEDAKRMLQNISNKLHYQSLSATVETSQELDTNFDNPSSSNDAEMIEQKEVSLPRESTPCAESLKPIPDGAVAAISQIYDFVMFLDTEAKTLQGTAPDGDELSQNLEKFFATYNAVMRSRKNLVDFVLDLSVVLSNASELKYNVLGYKDPGGETGISDCIDKVALPENSDTQELSGGKYQIGCAQFSDSSSDHDISHEGNPVPTSDLKSTPWRCSFEEYEQLKQEKDNMAVELARCTEDLDNTKSQLLETEKLMDEVKSQLTTARRMNGLAETQLKCMAESYNSLETRAEELQKEVDRLRAKTETLEDELQVERRSYQDALVKCNDLEEELQRLESLAAENDSKTSQEQELTAAVEKLAECQDTIYLLSKQLKSLRPQTEVTGSPIGRSQHSGEDPTISGLHIQESDAAEMDTATSGDLQRLGSESPSDLYNAQFSPSDPEANNESRSPTSSKHQKHRSTKSSTSIASSILTPEKHSRGFSRFFSSKAKSGN
ncbi:hypothetical protein LIER_12949 [Lithospermum erythrorhizon]|uniref:Filament-like plant protein 4 n=1 Tax=Lithospermum erythrorhizon TaxID=34254 RepID=A0AAV3PY71_LITER